MVLSWISWLVGGDWNMTFMNFHNWECYNPNWLIFFRWVGQPPTSHGSFMDFMGFRWCEICWWQWGFYGERWFFAVNCDGIEGRLSDEWMVLNCKNTHQVIFDIFGCVGKWCIFLFVAIVFSRETNINHQIGDTHWAGPVNDPSSISGDMMRWIEAFLQTFWTFWLMIGHKPE